jgi:hypothetical protein
MTVLII